MDRWGKALHFQPTPKKKTDARAVDYRSTALEFGLANHRGLDPANMNVLHISGTAGHNWYGGADLSNYLRLALGLDHNLQKRRQF